MDKNIAALVREDARTVEVTFGRETSRYTYVTNLDLAEREQVVVYASNRLQIGTVVRVDKEALIEPNSDIKFNWVVCKVDMQHYLDNKSANEKIEQALATKYRENARKAFRDQVLGALPDAERAALQPLLGGTKA